MSGFPDYFYKLYKRYSDDSLLAQRSPITVSVVFGSFVICTEDNDPHLRKIGDITDVIGFAVPV